ncbi:MAG: FliH/SctL family protein [Candidatus Zixiibacteriota bacterium]
MSKLIRCSAPGPTVVVGSKHRDVEHEALAEQQLRRVFPSVDVVVGPDGVKQVPVTEAVKIVRDHEGHLSRTRQVAYDEGFAAGYEKGRAEGRTETQQVLGKFDTAISDAVRQRQQLLEQARRKILDLVIQLSRKVTFDAVSVDPESTMQIINAVIDTLVDKSRLKIKVNPEHFPTVRENIDRFLPDSADIKDLTIEPDPRVRYGGCLIETPTDDIDARVESQLKVLEETLRAAEDPS